MRCTGFGWPPSTPPAAPTRAPVTVVSGVNHPPLSLSEVLAPRTLILIRSQLPWPSIDHVLHIDAHSDHAASSRISFL